MENSSVLEMESTADAVEVRKLGSEVGGNPGRETQMEPGDLTPDQPGMIPN